MAQTQRGRIVFAFVALVTSACQTAPKSEDLMAWKNMPELGEPTTSRRSVSAASGATAADENCPHDEKYPNNPRDRFSYEGKPEQFRYVLSSKCNNQLMFHLSKRRWSLFANNLFDTGLKAPQDPGSCEPIMKAKGPHRTADGTCYFYDQKVYQNQPDVGAAGARFGRNIAAPTKEWAFNARENVEKPSPRLISKELLHQIPGRDRPLATTVNALAAAWLQMENHDWFSHGKNVRSEHVLPPVPGDVKHPDGHPLHPTRPDTSAENRNGYPVTFRNAVTHWWDGSQIYGSNAETIARVRSVNGLGKERISGGKIAVDEVKKKLYYVNGVPVTGFNDNWWVGLELLHTLFALEHNKFATKLKAAHPRMSDDEVFEKSRLVVAALMAKIHTVEWTPALLDNEVLHIRMYSNWYGTPPEFVDENPFLRANLDTPEKKARFLNGLVGTGALELFNVPFTLTEEFTSVYRMHPLVPESLKLRTAKTGAAAREKPLATEDTLFAKSEKWMNASSTDMMYTFLTNHPGAMTLNNYPKFFEKFEVERNTDGVDKVTMDMGTIDIFRDRERMVPRYNEFRRRIGLKPIAKFEELTNDAEIVKKLETHYEGDVEKMDLLVGGLGENDRYNGFAFGNTAFNIFIVMASRRLMADPYYSSKYTPEVYSQEGIDWVRDRSMITLLTEHFPELAARLTDKKTGRKVVNAFHPWY